VPEGLRARGTIIAREPLVLAGTEVLDQMFDHVVLLKHDGDRCAAGEPLATVEGNARTLLERERVALNFLQRLSGVATLARQYADAVAGTACRVLDTRKTTPGLRALEKRAAAAGGVTNHRMGLFDAILIKNNHIAAAGGIRAALQNAGQWPDPSVGQAILPASPLSSGLKPAARPAGSLPIEIEVRTLAELHEALDAGAQHLLLDNLTPAEAAAWVREIAGRATVELSGGITLETVRAYAETGADFVSVGAITHSARAADISFRLELL
jgi:nicotinate-nucleotide pyrophosphorylase (carboxylating)